MTAVPIHTSRGGFINLVVELGVMSEEVLELIRLARGPEPLTPARRAREFQMGVQKARIGDKIELSGFLLMREPPNSPKDAIYYLLSPLSPSELKSLPRDELRPYVVLRIGEASKVSGRLYSGAHVRVSGVIHAYPWGTMRALFVEELVAEDYSIHWLELSDVALTKSEFESLFMDTVYANYDFEKALVYSLFASPTLIGSQLSWGEGVSFSAFKSDERIALSVWETFRYIHSLLPWELKLKRDPWTEYVDPHLEIDFRLRDPNNTGVSYYVPTSRSMLKRDVPVPKWALPFFEGKSAVFLESKGIVSPDDPTARLSESPFILTEPIAYERNRELEGLMPNVVATIFLERAKLGSLNVGELGTFRRKFEDWLVKNRREYGEKFDALRLSGMVFETNTRYLLSAHLLGSMARFEGKLRKGLINDVLLINQEILDMWINELPPETLMKLVKNYERYISADKRSNIALSIFMDLESVSKDGSVVVGEFLEAMVSYGFSRLDAEKTLKRLMAEGYLYEPYAGKLRLIR